VRLGQGAEVLDWSHALPHQRELLTWRPPPDIDPGPVTEAVLGGWGSGKTYAQGMRYALLALQAGWHPAYAQAQVGQPAAADPAAEWR